jgi:hypothetical protein
VVVIVVGPPGVTSEPVAIRGQERARPPVVLDRPA